MTSRLAKEKETVADTPRLADALVILLQGGLISCFAVPEQARLREVSKHFRVRSSLRLSW